MTSIAKVKLQAGRPVIGRALAWWIGELAAAYRDAMHRLCEIAGKTLTIEAGDRRWLLRSKDRVLGEIDWEGADAASRRNKLRDLVGGHAGAGTLTVEIAPDRVLSKIVALPTEAKADLDRILGYEFERHFPFAAERVFYQHRMVGGSNEVADRLLVEIIAVPREIVAGILDELAAVGLQPSAIAVFSPHAGGPIKLSGALARPSAKQAASCPLALLVAVVAVIAAISWPAAQQFELAQIGQEITLLKPRADAVLREQQEARQKVARAAVVARLRGGRPPLVAVIDELSRQVPDGSWLTSFSISGPDIVLEGVSPSAAAISLGIGRNPAFEAARFRSPISRDSVNGLEHFHLGLTIREVRQ